LTYACLSVASWISRIQILMYVIWADNIEFQLTFSESNIDGWTWN
jgi:hypothetical protein